MRKLLKNKKRVLAYLLAGFAVLSLLFFIAISCIIGRDVKKLCFEAKKDYGGNCTDALVSLVKDEERDFGKRNSAIWALGQLGDSRVLPILQSLYTGYIPPRESWNKTISQYELKKAINLTSGELNMTAIIWRYGID